MQAAAGGSGDALGFERVTKRYGKGTLALDDVTWSARRGARVCLLGPNGAGKSTSIRLLQAALRPTAGRVTLLGAAVEGPEYLEARRRTGIVPQGPGMYTDLTTGEYLELSRRLYGRGTPVDVARVVERFGLGPHLRKMLAQLSGGFQRRLCLAAALLTEPEVLLLDEPTVGLDPVAAHEVHGALREAMHGRTTLLCTHNLAEAEALCDQVIILRAGKMLLHEPLAALRARTAPHLRLAARQGSEALAAALRTRGLTPQPDGTADGVSLPLPDPRASAPDLLRGLLADGLDVYECRSEQATLAQLFLEVVGADAAGSGDDAR